MLQSVTTPHGFKLSPVIQNLRVGGSGYFVRLIGPLLLSVAVLGWSGLYPIVRTMITNALAALAARRSSSLMLMPRIASDGFVVVCYFHYGSACKYE